MALQKFNHRWREREFEHFFEPFAPYAPRAYYRPTDFSGGSDPVPSIYPGLFNLAQLSCLRYNVRRAIVTLISHDTQYVLAEATRTVSSSSRSSSHDSRDNLLFGHTAIPRSQGLCFRTLSKDSAQDWVETDLHSPDAPDTSNLNSHVQKTVRAFAGVPIVSPDGYPIGVLALLDDVPRPDFTVSNLAVLRDISADVARHVCDMRTGLEHARHVRMINGLSALISGRTSIRLGTDQSNSKGLSERHASREGQMNLEQDEDKSQVHMLASDVRKLQNAARPSRQRAASSQDETPQSIDASEQLNYFENPSSRLVQPQQARNHAQTPSAQPPKRPPSRWSNTTGIDELFARASNIIREAMEVEGVVFLSSPSLQTSNHGLEDDTLPTARAVHRKDGQSELCTVAGFSTTVSSSINGDTAPEYAQQLPAATLNSLVHHYPTGKHLHPARYYESSSDSDLMGNEDDGAAYLSTEGSTTTNGSSRQVPSDLETQESLDVSRKRNEPAQGKRPTANLAKLQRKERQSLIKRILAYVDGANSMLYYPLWDTQGESWFAAVFVWTQRPNRVFSQTDLDFLSAFATNVMTEVAHLNTLNIERVKSKFVSTISHELRSPLHGLIGCTEALQHTSLSLFQADMLSGIKACGTTLLGTVNNLLDHADINHMQGTTDASVQNVGSSTEAAGTLTQHHSVDLAELTEEVVQSCVTGFEMSNYSVSSMQNARVVVEVEWGDPWLVEIPNGAWTRIITNLVDNALKFTHEGFVYIRLRRTSATEKGDELIVLEVTDSGIGMSESFVQQQLYRAFVQENPQSSGTGLGLSIVHHVVSLIGGQVRIETEQKQGTRAIVEVRLATRARNTKETPTDDDVLATALKSSRGLRVVLVGFGERFPAEDSHDIHGSNGLGQGDAAALEARVLETMFRDWFGMEVVAQKDQDMIPDIVVQNTAPGSAVQKPSRNDSRQHRFLTRPVTVRKFARALAAWKSAADDAATTPPEDDEQQQSHGDAPAADEPEPANEQPRVPSLSPSSSVGEGRLVLAVDDNELNLKLLIGALKKLKIRHITATNGAEAVEAFRGHSNEVTHILMDISMPIMDGFEATRQIRRLERDQAAATVAKIVALTGLGSQSAHEEARASGVDVYLTKPVKLQKLREVL